MCLRCLSRALKYLSAVEAAVPKTGGAAAVAVQVVHHAHCGDPLCANEGHVHVRARVHRCHRCERYQNECEEIDPVRWW